MSPETTKKTSSSSTSSAEPVELYESGFIDPPYSHACALLFAFLVLYLLGSALKEILKERKLLRQAQEADLEDKPLSVELRIVDLAHFQTFESPESEFLHAQAKVDIAQGA